MHVAIYARVSTTRQAEHDLSIPEQRRKAEAYCEAKGWTVVQVFEERGASGTTDKRPELQRMLRIACSAERPFDVVIVYNLSRFARNAADAAIMDKQLTKRRVKLVSIMEDFGDDANGRLIKGVMNSVYEHQSAFSSAVVSGAMIANAREGFWNGSQAPFGYRTIVAETRGLKEKKKLAIHPPEAEIAKRIFELYARGDGTSGPLGIKSVVKRVNAAGFRTRLGKPFAVQFVGKILRNEAYVGRCWFNRRDSKTRLEKPREEWIGLEVPAVVEASMFAAAQEKLDAFHPMKTAPRMATSSVLLAGIAKCGLCGASLKAQTGKNNAYRYYVCARCVDEGSTSCRGVRIARDALDQIVLKSFCENVLKPDRIQEITSALAARASVKTESLRQDLRALKDEQKDIDRKIGHLYGAVENGVTLDDSLRNRIAKLQERRDQVTKLAAAKDARLEAPLEPVPADKAAAFAEAARERLMDKGRPEFARAYLRLMVSEVRLGREEIRITGPKNALASAAAAHTAGATPVLSFEQDWRTRQDSNL
ncbi:MAG: recombinase family protein [Alphaproteobacteria bacterium]